MAGEVSRTFSGLSLKHFGGKFSGHLRFEAYGFGLWSAFQTWALGLLQTGTMAGPLRLAGYVLFMTCEMLVDPPPARSRETRSHQAMRNLSLRRPLLNWRR